MPELAWLSSMREFAEMREVSESKDVESFERAVKTFVFIGESLSY